MRRRPEISLNIAENEIKKKKKKKNHFMSMTLTTCVCVESCNAIADFTQSFRVSYTLQNTMPVITNHFLYLTRSQHHIEKLSKTYTILKTLTLATVHTRYVA